MPFITPDPTRPGSFVMTDQPPAAPTIAEEAQKALEDGNPRQSIKLKTQIMLDNMANTDSQGRRIV